MGDNLNDKLEHLLPKEKDEIQDNNLKEIPKDKNPKNNNLIYFIIFIFAILFGNYKFLQKAQDNIILSPFQPNQVLLFNEIKKISKEILTENGKEMINQTIATDFLVTINYKKKLNYFGVINYLYNATLILFNQVYDKEINQGLNFDDKNIIKQILNHPENYSQSIAKFAFYENGSLAEIYLSKDIDFFNASSMIDLIENIIPKISRKLYNEFTEENIKYTYEENKNIKILSEIQEEKDLKDKYSKITFKGSLFNKNIKRRFKNNKIERISYESEIKLLPGNYTEKERDLFNDIGINSIKVNSEFYIRNNKNDKYLIKSINLMLRKLKFEESQQLLEQLTKKKTTSTKYENLKEKNDIYNNNNELVNLRMSLDDDYNDKYEILTIIILGREIKFLLIFNFDNGYKKQIILGAEIDGETLRIKRFFASSSGNYNYPLIRLPFKLGIPLEISIEFECNYTLKYSYNINSYGKDREVKIDITSKLNGILFTNSPIISLGVNTNGELFKITGIVEYNAMRDEISCDIISWPCDFSLYAIVKTLSGYTYKKEICHI